MRIKHRRLSAVAALSAVALTLSACGSGTGTSAEETPENSATVTVEDNNGTHEIATPPTSVVATDNRTFQTLDDWGVELKAGAVALMPESVSYTQNEDVIDLGNHREPNLEAVVEAQPDLIINGQRFAQYQEDLAKLAPDATILNLDPRDDQPLDAELKRQTEVLGEVFGKQEEAKQLNEDFDASIERVKEAYNSDDKVMGVITSGGDINYSAPKVGRTLGPVFDILDLTPSIEAPEGASDDHTGDDISVEAIADSNPDWLLVMDRDTAVEDDAKPAQSIIEESQALKNVNAVKNGNIVYMPKDTYLAEGIQTYTTFFNDLADAMENSQ
ncbi:siderophore ABC transporter substrate-binding protein [Brevibacterium luteolum]|uniref:ABC transporter substrate-binding protein n=1 Tax=Brevibacterium luteolum TaxID=199591 RepID=A0A849APF5_9MICO|nr:ABC transporter substrate-binding protein [Brevibacterium luteolum]MBM7529800.1 iron complex transport system substrate-binding protein [Brevibacterium luteolum]MCT1829939.1 ABC transporter substrate-binding protein [Brevibacterium luteolum]MCT1872918.1 ABC transporter substrate-binding protein [Brevibacterium luteolum]MCT1890811.1 ABC transporter substrate-binding protein [Brevibacterium luteolum]MCT1892360.1 ABC transporter substrate-binding protein [Brevibacterium luteolum]